jgi:DNA-binding XRE family transcriptional regulator
MTRQTTLPTGVETELSPEKIHRLYHREGLTISKIADRLGVSSTTIFRRMEKHGIGRREWPSASGVPLSTDHEGYERWRHQYRHNGQKCEETVSVHRLFAVSLFGLSALKLDVVIHHENGIPWDNRESNIALMTRQGHSEYHNADSDSL